jgi:hypothetical protein
MKQIGSVGKASSIAVGAVLALMVSGCARSSDPSVASPIRATTPSASSTPGTGATTSPKATGPATKAPQALSKFIFGPKVWQVRDVRLADKKLTMALTGPQDSTFRVRSGSGHVSDCVGDSGTRVPSAEKDGLPANFIQRYIVTCGPMSNHDKKSTLLIHSKLGGYQYQYEKPLAVAS